MGSSICLYIEENNGTVSQLFKEMVTAAETIANITGENISAITVTDDPENIIKSVKGFGIDDLYLIKSENNMDFKDDSKAKAISELINRLKPSAVIIPATSQGRSVFSRVGVITGSGMTADCTQLKDAKNKDGSDYILQNKPSFGENVFVSIITRKGKFPQILTVRPGVYEAKEETEKETNINIITDIEVPESKIKIKSINKLKAETDSIMGAETVVVTGRGTLENNNMDLVRTFAEKIGGAIGGTRPLADCNLIPFDHQIGQTGLTIRPKVCVSFGVSGAIQHTEGIKDTKLYIAVNKDPDAAIFRYADYGIVADMHELLEEFNIK